MYKNQLQELAQRSCFNLPSYSCIREGPDHAPRFKSTVKFNGEAFESPGFCTTLRQAEHAAAEVALTTLAKRGPSRALAARVLDETGVYKNLLQETAHRAGLNLPIYTTVRSGPGHVPVFSCTVELAGMSFTGEHGRTKKQAQKNAAIAAWSILKRLAQDGLVSSPPVESKGNEEQDQVTIARVLTSLCPSETRISLQNDYQNTLQRSIPIHRRPELPSSYLSPVQFQSWPYPSYSPEMAMYEFWQQEQLLQHQIHLFHLPVLPSAPVPPPFPVIQPLIHPNDQRLYFPVINQEPSSTLPARITIAPSRPSLCFPDRLGTELLRASSTVTIQEIQDEKSEESEPFILCKCNTEPISQVNEPVKEDNKWANSVASRSEPVDFRPPNPCGLRPNSTAPPVTIRTVRPQNLAMALRPQNLATALRPQNLPLQLPSFSARPLPCGTGFGGVRHSFMAPAVRIRSVVPVCSAPPPRKNPGPSDVSDRKDTSAESSEPGKLQI